MKTLLVAVNCSYSHASLAIPYLQAACRAWLTACPLPIKKEYHLRQSAETTARDLADERPDIIGFSCYIFNITFILKVVRMVRDMAPGVMIVFGGPEMADGGEDLISMNEGADFIIRGEGERSFVNLLGRLSGEAPIPLSDISGLTWPRGGTVMCNDIADPVEPLDSIPSPFKAGLNASGSTFAIIETSRGCPFRCDFCLSGTGEPLREFSIERVFEDIDIIARQDVRTIRFLDRTFNASASRAVAILEYLEQNHPDMAVHVELEPSLLNSPVLLKRLNRETVHVEIGLQDLDSLVLRNVHRNPLKPETLDSVQNLCLESKCAVHLDLIAGLPGGTLSGLYKNTAELTGFAPEELQIEILKILKGTRLSDDNSIVHDERPPYAVRETPDMTRSDIKEACLLSRLVDMFYNDEHLGPIMRCACVFFQSGEFWPSFCRWWRNHAFASFGVGKMKKFDRLLMFLTDRPIGSNRRKLVCQWVFRRLCYAKLKPRSDFDGVKYLEGGKLKFLPPMMRKFLKKPCWDSQDQSVGAWSLWRFEHDPLCLDPKSACVSADYLWIWDNPRKTSDSHVYKIE